MTELAGHLTAEAATHHQDEPPSWSALDTAVDALIKSDSKPSTLPKSKASKCIAVAEARGSKRVRAAKRPPHARRSQKPRGLDWDSVMAAEASMLVPTASTAH